MRKSQETQALILDPSQSCCVTSGMLLDLSETPFPPLNDTLQLNNLFKNLSFHNSVTDPEVTLPCIPNNLKEQFLRAKIVFVFQEKKYAIAPYYQFCNDPIYAFLKSIMLC